MAQINLTDCNITIPEIDAKIEELKSQHIDIRRRSKKNKHDDRMLDMEHINHTLTRRQVCIKEREQIHVDGVYYFNTVKPEIRRLREIRKQLVDSYITNIRAHIKQQKIQRAMSDSREEREKCKRKIRKYKAKICEITSHINETMYRTYLMTELQCDRCKKYYPYEYSARDAY